MLHFYVNLVYRFGTCHVGFHQNIVGGRLNQTRLEINDVDHFLVLDIVGGRLNQTRLEINDVKITFSVNIFQHFYDVLISTIGWEDIGQL